MVYKANQLSLKNNTDNILKTASLINLGCPKNQVIAEKIIFVLQQNAYRYLPFHQHTAYHLLLVNTCGFIQSAREETNSTLILLDKYHQVFPDTKIVILGCDVTLRLESLKKSHPEFLFISDRDPLPVLQTYLSLHRKEQPFFQTLSSPWHAYIQVAEGCDHHCAYCLIPAIKGKYRSFSIESILMQVKNLINRFSIKEIILIAQDSSSFGKDLSGNHNLIELANKLSALNGIEWIRCLYLYPVSSKQFIRDLLSVPKVLPYIDLPCQHVSRNVLSKMGRPAPIESTIESILELRSEFPLFTFRTTFIVGFPGETETDFLYLLDSLKKYQFDRVGFFPYSDEPATRSFLMKDKLSEDVKQDRLKKAYATQKEVSIKLNNKWIQKELQVLIEEYDPIRKSLIGRSVREAPDVDPKVLINTSSPNPRQWCGQIKGILIEQADAYQLKGRFLH